MLQILRAEAKRTHKLVNLLVDRSVNEADERVELLERVRKRFGWIEDAKERLLFPLLAITPLAELAADLRVERSLLEGELAALAATPPDSERFGLLARLVARRLDGYWARDRRELFPKARRAIPKDILEELTVRVAGEQRAADGSRRPELR